MARLFFALWPDDALRQQVAAQAVALQHAHEGGGRLIGQERLHLTVRFLGDYPAGELDRRREAALGAGSQVAFAPFDLALDHAGSFGRRTWWLGPAASAALTDLRAGLDRTLAAAGFAASAETFVPHVTIVRGALRALPPSPIAPLAWRVRGFALVESRAGQPYRSVQHWGP